MCRKREERKNNGCGAPYSNLVTFKIEEREETEEKGPAPSRASMEITFALPLLHFVYYMIFSSHTKVQLKKKGRKIPTGIHLQ